MKANERTFQNFGFRWRSIGLCLWKGECIVFFVCYECGEKWRESKVKGDVLSNFHSLERAISMKHIDRRTRTFIWKQFILSVAVVTVHHFTASHFFFVFFFFFVSIVLFVILTFPCSGLWLSRLLSSFHNWLTFTRVHKHRHTHAKAHTHTNSYLLWKCCLLISLCYFWPFNKCVILAYSSLN